MRRVTYHGPRGDRPILACESCSHTTEDLGDFSHETTHPRPIVPSAKRGGRSETEQRPVDDDLEPKAAGETEETPDAQP